ncbi:MAG: hypothetical protein ACI310_00540 [Bacilli bacterium]
MLKALDLLRRLGWAVIDFIYNLIDTLFNILKELNLYDIVDSVSDNTIFKNFHSGIIAIAITLLALFIAWRFVMKILEPDEGLSTHQIVMEIIKCSVLVLMSVFLFTQANTLSMKLSGYTSNIFTSNGTTLSDSMLTMYVNHSEGYKASDEFKNEDIGANIKNDKFTKKRMFNDKYVTNSRWILPDEKDYKYDINWIMAIIVGGFFLYALFFSGMMLARRQIEFLFLFLISPIVFATSIGNKQRRSAVIEQLVSLMLQGAVVMMIIGITVIVMQSINSTTFFANSQFKDMALKSLMFIGCGTFLLTGSQVINRFIGANVSANSGREQLMSLMSYGHTMSMATHVGSNALTGAGAFGLGVASSAIGKVGGNKVVNKVGNTIQKFGNSIKGSGGTSSSPIGNMVRGGIGNTIEKFGCKVKNSTPSNIGKSMRMRGRENMGEAVSSIMPQRNMYRRRYRSRE